MASTRQNAIEVIQRGVQFLQEHTAVVGQRHPTVGALDENSPQLLFHAAQGRLTRDWVTWSRFAVRRSAALRPR
jgi:hypothetical protein